MKRLYNRVFSFLSGIPKRTEITKSFIAEWYAIIRKKRLYKNVIWTKEQQTAFDSYWKENYGKKISNRWHKLYQAGNGVFCIEYIPEMLYTTQYAPKVNAYEYCSVFSDKTLNGVFFNGRLDGVKTPDSIIFNNYGRFCDDKRRMISKEKAIELISNVGEAVIKPTVDTSSGRGVRIIHMVGGMDTRTGESCERIFEQYKKNFIVQEKIKPHPELQILYPSAINTFRVISYVVNDNIMVAPISLRIGSGGGEVDNIHAGGISIGVNNDGTLNKYAFRLGYGDSYEKYTEHPDTKVVFESYRLSFVNELITAAKRLHEMTANIGVISWDFTVDSEGRIIVVEVNLKGQSVWFPQILSGRALFGEDTAEVLRILNKHE